MRLKLLLFAKSNCSVFILLVAVLWFCAPEVGRAQQPAESWSDFYEPQRAEMLTDQAGLALLEGRYPEAESLIDQAIQVNRASLGLFNSAQLQLMDRLLETLLIQGKWDEFDAKLDYLNWLRQRIYADDPVQLANGLLRQSDWHRAAAGVIQRSQSAWYLIQGKYLNWQAVSVLENNFGTQDPRLTPILYQIVLEHYYQSVLNERRGTTSYEFKTDGKAIANGWMNSRNESVRRSYRIGRDNLQRIREIYRMTPGTPRTTDSLLQIHQADWEFLHGNNQVALQLYQSAYSGLVKAGITEQALDRYFGQLNVLPAQKLQVEWQMPAAGDNESVIEFSAWSPLYPGAGTPAEFRQPPFRFVYNEPRRALVEVKLDIAGDPLVGDFNYVVSRLKVVEAEPADDAVISQVLAEIPTLKFRPRLVAGELRSHDNFFIDFQLAEE